MLIMRPVEMKSQHNIHSFYNLFQLETLYSCVKVDIDGTLDNKKMSFSFFNRLKEIFNLPEINAHFVVYSCSKTSHFLI